MGDTNERVSHSCRYHRNLKDKENFEETPSIFRDTFLMLKQIPMYDNIYLDKYVAYLTVTFGVIIN